MTLLTRSARTRWGASLAAAVALSGATVLVPSAASSTTPPAATVDYLADAYGLPAGHVLENLTFERFEFLLGSEGTYAFLLGSPTDADLRRVAPRIDAVARELGVDTVYTFDPVLDGASVDIRTSPLTDVAALYTRVSATLNEDTTPEFGAGADPFLFVYDRDRQEDGSADRIAASLTTLPSAGELATADGAAAFDAQVREVLTAGGELDESTQREFYTTEVNRKHAVQYLGRPNYGPDVFTDADQDFRLVNVSYPELKHLLGSPGDHVVFFGGTWCHNTRAVIKDVNDQAIASGTDTVYVFDNRLDGQSAGNLHIRDTSSKLAHLYGDLVRTYLPNLVTQYVPESNGVTYYPGGDTSATPLVARKLQVPYVLEYSKDRKVDGAAAPIKRQWIKDNGDGTYREYMTEWWYRNHLPGGVTNEATLANNYAFADEAVAKLVEFFAAVKADRTPAPAPEPTPTTKPTPTPTPKPTTKPTTKPAPAPTATTTKLSLSTTKPSYGTQVRATVTVTGGVAGKVTVREGKKILATVSVPAKGRAVAKLPAKLGIGKHTVAAQFTPASAAKAKSSTSARATFTVRRAKAQTAVKVVKKPTAGKSGSVRVTVTAKGSSVRAGGSYVVKVRGTVVAKGRLTNGTGTARLPKLAAGKHEVQFSYKGSPQVAKANRTITVTVR